MNFVEVGVPLLKAKIRIAQEENELQVAGKSGRTMTRAEAEAKKEVYPGVFMDYSEMAIQFGYTTLFAAAFPMGALLALINNIIEIRSDAFSLCRSHRRYEYNPCQDIGTWATVLESVSVISIMTNSLLVRALPATWLACPCCTFSG